MTQLVLLREIKKFKFDVLLLRIEAQKLSASERGLRSVVDGKFSVNTTNLYKILAQGRNNVTANVYGGNIDKVSMQQYQAFITLCLYFLLQINFDDKLWRVHNYYHSSHSRREKQVDTSITGISPFYAHYLEC